MSGNQQVCAARATAIAITNALVQHLKCGQFLSQIDVGDHGVKSKLGLITEVSVTGRTNTDEWFTVAIGLVHQQIPCPGFPFKEFVASIIGVRGEMMKESERHFVCRINSQGISFTCLLSSPW